MLCVLAKIDDVSTEQLQALQDIAASHGALARKIHGHITLVTYVGNDEAGYMTHCKNMLQGLRPFNFRYDRVAVWPASAMIAVSPPRLGSLMDLHNLLAENHRESLNQWSQTDTWAPHTTLVYGQNLDLTGICARIQEKFRPVTARTVRIEFSRVMGNQYEILDFIDLNP